MEDIVAIVLLFGGGSVILFAFSPIGKAIADRIRGSGTVSHDPVESHLPEVLADVDHLRSDLTDMQERLDFMERVLARRPDHRRLPGEVGVDSEARPGAAGDPGEVA